MPVARAMVRVGDDSPLREDALLHGPGRACGVVELGVHRDLVVSGSSVALRRLGCAMLRAADLADEAAPAIDFARRVVPLTQPS